MSMIVETNIGEICTICREEFSPRERKYNHVDENGKPANHDPFHRSCLAQWIIRHPTCPLDRQLIDPSSLISRTERIMERLRPALVNAAYAAFFGMITGVAGVVSAGIAAPAAVGAAPAAGIAAGIAGAAVRAGGAGAAAVVAVGAGAGIAAGAAGAAVRAVGAGAAGIAGVGVGIGIKRVLEHRGFDPIVIENIAIGMLAGGTACVDVEMTGIVFTPLTAISTISLIGGAAAGILFLVRRH